MKVKGHLIALPAGTGTRALRLSTTTDTLLHAHPRARFTLTCSEWQHPQSQFIHTTQKNTHTTV